MEQKPLCLLMAADAYILCVECFYARELAS